MAGHRAVVAAGVLALAACADRSDLPFPEGAHRVEDGALSEMSGLVASGGDPQVLWSINDSGSFARLYRLGVRGEALGRVRVAGAWLHDTETLARWRSGGRDWLLIGDVGDNRTRRDHVVGVLKRTGLIATTGMSSSTQITMTAMRNAGKKLLGSSA